MMMVERNESKLFQRQTRMIKMKGDVQSDLPVTDFVIQLAGLRFLVIFI
jgi:hypothetical protein